MEDRYEKMRFGLLDAARNTTGMILFYKEKQIILFLRLGREECQIMKKSIPDSLQARETKVFPSIFFLLWCIYLNMKKA